MCNEKRERGPYPERGLTGDITPVAPHQCTHVGQAHAFAGDVLSSHPAEGLKGAGDVVLGNALPVVMHCEHGHAWVLYCGNGDLPWSARFETGHRIGQKVAKDLRQSEVIGVHHWQRPHRHLDLPLGDLVRQRA